MGFKDYERKKVYVKLNSNAFYTGTIKEVAFIGKDTNDVDVYIFSMIDKFGKLVSFSNKEISTINEQNIDDHKKKGEKDGWSRGE